MLFITILRNGFRRILGGFRWLMLLVLMLLLLQSENPQSTPYFAIAAEVRDAHFDYIGWELGAIGAKAQQALTGTHNYLSERERSDFVRTYFADLATVQGIEVQIEATYADPNIDNADDVSAPLRQERDMLRASLQTRQTMTEAILEGQVSKVLVEEGFGVGGQLLPPLNMRFVGTTLLLVTSPRDSITMKHPMTLSPIPVDQREAIEQRVLDEQDLAAVIVPIGGMALYPAMVVESSSLSYTIETFAHEWLHHYLMFHPLGWEAELAESGEARIINETTASIFGREMGRKVLERYYPELVPPPTPPPPANAAETQAPPPEPPAFDYNIEMHETRTTVDALLAAGEIETAEDYMEERRTLFFENGYRIRKMNQAWFAFYGGYQVSGISAGGEDPIGPAVQTLRDSSASIKAWVVTMQRITTRDQLLAVATP